MLFFSLWLNCRWHKRKQVMILKRSKELLSEVDKQISSSSLGSCFDIEDEFEALFNFSLLDVYELMACNIYTRSVWTSKVAICEYPVYRKLYVAILFRWFSNKITCWLIVCHTWWLEGSLVHTYVLIIFWVKRFLFSASLSWSSHLAVVI